MRHAGGSAVVDDDRPAAVDREHLPGDGARLVGQEVDRGLRDLVRVRHLAGQRLLAPGVREDVPGPSAARGGHRRGGQRRRDER